MLNVPSGAATRARCRQARTGQPADGAHAVVGLSGGVSGSAIGALERRSGS
jgi:hypothetical protein